VALLLGSGRARAEFLSSFSGNTNPTDSSSVSQRNLDGTYNFGVLDRTTGGVAGDVFGAVTNYDKPVNSPDRYAANFDSKFVPGSGSGALDTSARYLYLFQIVNNGPNTNALQKAISYIGDASLITSWGYFGAGTSKVGLNNGQGQVTYYNDFATQGNTGNFAPDALATTNAVKPGVVSIAKGDGNGNIDPGIRPVTVTLVGNDLVTTFGGGELANDHRSVLIGFTSNHAPGLVNDNNGSDVNSSIFRLYDGNGHFAQGHAPIPMPEPSALVLVAVGLAVGLFFGLRRRKSAACPAVA
jgi:hypothetical protein